MKRTKLLLTIGIITVLAFTGCGKAKGSDGKLSKAEQKELEEIKKSYMEDGFSGDAAAAMAEEDMYYEKAKEESEAAIAAMKTYPRDPSFDTMETPYLAVQIDDKIYPFGVTVGEIMAIVESSENEYGPSEHGLYDYNSDKLIKVNESGQISMSRADKNWIEIHYYNPKEEMLSIDNCLVKYVTPTKDSIPFSYIFGIDPSAWENLKYDDVKALADPGNTLAGFKVDNSLMDNAFSFTKTVKTDNGLSTDIEIIINVDLNTNSISRIVCSAEKPTEQVSELESFDGLTIDDFKYVDGLAREAFEKSPDCKGYELLNLQKAVLLKNRLVLIYDQITPEGNKNYMFFASPLLGSVTYGVNNGVIADAMIVRYEYDTMEELEDRGFYWDAIKQENILDSLEF